MTNSHHKTRNEILVWPLKLQKVLELRLPWYVAKIIFKFIVLQQLNIILQDINEMCQQERPDWQSLMAYITQIYKHFEY